MKVPPAPLQAAKHKGISRGHKPAGQIVLPESTGRPADSPQSSIARTTRMKLMQGAPLQRYYPLHEDAREEYEEWRKSNPLKPQG